MLTYLVLAILVTLGIFYCSVTIFNQTFLFIYLFIEYRVGAINAPNDYPPVPISRYFCNYCIELFYVLGKYYLLPLRFQNFSITKNRNSNTAILLVHGYCRNQTDWWWLRKQFNNIPCPIFCVNLAPKFAAIDEIALQSLPREIDLIKKQTGCEKIILIGHSMGGLVSCYYSEFLDLNKHVIAVITIASPLYGTTVSVSGRGENAQQMCPKSKFLEGLREKMNADPKKYYQIITRLDNIVFPWRSALLESTPATQQYILPNTAHLSLLHSKPIAIQLNAWLQDILNLKNSQSP